MGLIIKIHRAEGALEQIITKSGDVSVVFYNLEASNPFMRFNKDGQTDVHFTGRVELYTESGVHLGTTKPKTLEAK